MKAELTNLEIGDPTTTKTNHTEINMRYKVTHIWTIGEIIFVIIWVIMLIAIISVIFGNVNLNMSQKYRQKQSMQNQITPNQPSMQPRYNQQNPPPYAEKNPDLKPKTARQQRKENERRYRYQ